MCHSWTLERTALLLRCIHRAGEPGTIPRRVLSQARLRGLWGPRNNSVRLLLLLRAAARHAKPHRARTYLVLLTGTGTWATLHGMGGWSDSVGHRTSVRLHVSSSARPNPTCHIIGHAVHHPPSKLLRLPLLAHRTRHLLGWGLLLLLWSSWNARLLLRERQWWLTSPALPCLVLHQLMVGIEQPILRPTRVGLCLEKNPKYTPPLE